MGADVGGADTAKSEPNVVPLCDILLVLLIIFMVVTPMIKKGVHVQLPEASNTQDQPEPGQLLTVYVKEDGTVVFNGGEIELAKLTTKLEEVMEDSKKEGEKILLNADENTEYGKIVDVMNEIKNANVESVGLITKKATSSD